MANVVFLSRNTRYGAKSVIGPVTRIGYTIQPHGTPVSEFDAAGLLEMTEPPCCGPGPFIGEVRSFGVTRPTKEQLDAVPDYLWEASPPVVKEKPKRVERLFEDKKYEKPVVEEPVKEEPIIAELENFTVEEYQED